MSQRVVFKASFNLEGKILLIYQPSHTNKTYYNSPALAQLKDLNNIPMAEVQDLYVSILKSRSFGIYPPSQSIISNGGDNQETTITGYLSRALQIEQRTQNLSTPATSSDVSLLIKDTEVLLSSLAITTEFITQLILSVNLGHLYHLNGEHEKSLKVLTAIKLIEGEVEFSYVKALYYKTYWIIASCHLNLNRLDNTRHAVSTGVNLFHHIPLSSELESASWLLKLFDYVKAHCLAEVDNVTEVVRFFKNENFVIYYLNYINVVLNGTESFIKTRSGGLLSSISFPKAKEENNYELEEFFECLSDSNLNNLIALTSFTDLIEQGISKTYQSQKILKSYVKVLFKTKGKSIELEASLDVLITYIENYYHLNNSQYYDILAMLDLFHIVMSKGMSLRKFERFLGKFKSILADFYKINKVDLAHKDHQETYFHNGELRMKFSRYWYSVAMNELSLLKSSDLIEESSFNFSSIVTAFDNSIVLNPLNEDIMFDYILNLCNLRQVKGSYKLLKESLKTVTPDSKIYFRSLHLLALILSVEDNKDEAFKISSFLNSEIEQFLATVDPTALEFKLKEKLIEIKITHLSIIEAHHAVDQALDSLKDLFITFNTLFSDIIIQNEEEEEDNEEEEVTEQVIGGEVQLVQPIKSHRKSLSLAKQQTLTKIRSITHKKHTKDIKPKSKTETFKISKDHKLECKLLQKIWLVSSQIYFKNGMFKESEESLLESESSYYCTDETSSQLANLLIQGSRFKLAFKEFEKGLNLNKSSIACVVGLSNLILNHSTDPEDSNSIFINEKDQLAALARAKLILEESSKTFKGFHTSEIWLLLSQIYEKFGDKKRLQKSLWRAIQLEESRPVRDFSCV
ncbi:hypothetical protein WICPIJ_000359 [Wickerhamomyces pijperi]|uniref:Cargo-transport protein YPP1 n=1 Tax=Wickerhamomyces pijperi TaxID=599730 RepID=A0A9P8TQX6_WICPI|nr:hypothetical protein WICPIJ_000359 [Wickerhamomyces pijperi]